MRQWFVSWVAYDVKTNQLITEHSSSAVYNSDDVVEAEDVLDGIKAALQNPRPEMYIHITAFNRV
ncbi:hypothetical protein HVX06_08225 [Enterobacter sp. RHB15-C17]|nr:hypothetical protein HVX06_08225 [Enterobacter sp. RHB15-C17]